MKTPSKRNRRVADLIHREVALLMKTEISDPRLTNIIITAVDVSSDLSNARVFYILSEKNNEHSESDIKGVNAALKKAAGFIRRELAMRAELRYTPQIDFRYDDSIAHANH